MTEQAEEPQPAPHEGPVGVPDMIRVMGDGSLAVDDDRHLGLRIPHGTPFYSEAVVSDLKKRLALAEATAEGVKGEEVAGLDFRHGIMGLPLVLLLDLTNAALNRLSLRGLSDACFEVGITPEFKLAKGGKTDD